MTPQQIIKALESAHKILEVIDQDPGWSALANDEAGDPDLPTDMNDALHYLSEMISKLEDSLYRQLSASSVSNQLLAAVEACGIEVHRYDQTACADIDAEFFELLPDK